MMAEQLVPVIRVADVHRSLEWYAKFGFDEEFVSRYTEDFPAYMSIRRGDIAIHLSEHPGDATPDSLLFVFVGDVDALAVEHLQEISESAWARSVTFTDPDGNRIRFGCPKEVETLASVATTVSSNGVHDPRHVDDNEPDEDAASLAVEADSSGPDSATKN